MSKKLGNQIRVMKNGVPAYVAPWYKELTKQGQSMIGQNKIMSAYNPRTKSLTTVEYTYKTAEQFLAGLEPYPFAIAAE